MPYFSQLQSTPGEFDKVSEVDRFLDRLTWPMNLRLIPRHPVDARVGLSFLNLNYFFIMRKRSVKVAAA